MADNVMPFMHDGSIPRLFALCVWAIRANLADAEDWETLDMYEDLGAPVMVWINSIIMTNEPDISDDKLVKEIVWWRTELDKKP